MWKNALNIMENYRNQTIFVGCSGGIDSMVLIHFLAKNQFNIHVLHVNYRKRAKASDDDMEFVKTYCEKNKLPFDSILYNSNPKGNFQENARKFRYDFFESFTQKNGVIALAHHSDDQIETFFMNTMRQSGILGLASIPVVRENYIRPLLGLSKQDLLEYAQQNNIEWREDASNQESNYLRNKWRLEFIPKMQNAVPEVKGAALILIKAFQLTQQELELKVVPIAKSIVETKQLSHQLYNSLSSEELFELWRQLKQNSQHFQRFEELKNYDIGKFIETPDYKIFNEGTYFSFVDLHTDIEIPELEISFVNHLPIEFTKNEMYLDPTKIKGDLTIRKWKKGDKIAPIGVKGTQTVSQIIRDAKVPFFKRSEVLVVHDDAIIHWVVGLKIGRTAIAKPENNEILKLKI